jgi:ketosteroid isomerase-like protein
MRILSGSRRTIVKLAVSCLLFTLCAFAQTAKEAPSPDAGNLVALERMWNEAQVNRDVPAIASMIGDRFINTEFDGEVSDRGKFLADFADPKFELTFMNIQDVKVEMYGNAAVVTGTYHTKGTYGGKPYDHIGRFTDTWILQNGKWLCAASHSSLLKK